MTQPRVEPPTCGTHCMFSSHLYRVTAALWISCAPPPADQPVLLVCSKGPKSLVALDFLADLCPRAVCVAGGIAAWDEAALPTEDVLRADS